MCVHSERREEVVRAGQTGGRRAEKVPENLRKQACLSSFVLLGPPGSVQHVRKDRGMEKGEKE